MIVDRETQKGNYSVDKPLFIISNCLLRQQEENQFATGLSLAVIKEPMRNIDELIAEWHFRRYVPIPVVTGLTGLYIRPFWRDQKVVPPLPIRGRSGKIYKNGQKIPSWEIDYS